MADDERKTTATRSGFHYLSTYQSCRWRWYLNHVRKIVPLKVSRYLLFGQAFHAAKEAFYKGEARSRKDFIQYGIDWLKSLKDQYEKIGQYEDDITKMGAMTIAWYDTFAADEFDKYEILAIEQEYLIPLPAGFVMTVRPDAVVRERESGMIFAFETKTTSRSVSEMARSVACQQQVDTQIMGIFEEMKTRNEPMSMMGGVIPDIVYRRQSVCRAERTAPIKRSTKELADTKLSFSGLFSEIGQKLKSLEDDVLPPEALFDRNGAWCAQFGCEYESICKSRFTGTPPGFKPAEY